MMDALAIQAAEAAVHPNFPPADTMLIVELDGPRAEVERAVRHGRGHLPAHRRDRRCEVAADEEQRLRIWKGRKAAFAAMGRISPNYYVQDGVVPRTKLPEVLARIRALSERTGLRIGNVFHAGDGNLHPLICYDESIPGQATLAEEVAGEILTYCVEAGGSITGEHGVGADKRDYMPRMFSDDRPRRDAAGARRLRPAAPLQSGQGAADAAAVRRGARPLSPAPGRAGRPGRALLMTAADTLDDAAAPADAIDGVTPRAASLEPDTAAELAVALAAATASRRSTVIRGGGTKVGWGRRPAPSIWCCPRRGCCRRSCTATAT